jgi:hypothetical protein
MTLNGRPYTLNKQLRKKRYKFSTVTKISSGNSTKFAKEKGGKHLKKKLERQGKDHPHGIALRKKSQPSQP